MEFLKRIFRFYLENRLYRNHFPWIPVVTYVGAGQSNNLGDWLLFNVINSDLKEIGLFPAMPRFFKNAILHWLEIVFLNILFAGYRNRKATILGGGTLIGSSHFHQLFLMHHKPNTPIIIYGTSVNKEGYDFLEDEMKVYSKATLSGVRDHYSKDCLRDYISGEISVIGDPVLRFPTNSFSPPDKIKIIGINLGSDQRMLWQSDIVLELVAFIEKLKITELKLLAFTPRDLISLNSLVENLPKNIKWTMDKVYLNSSLVENIMEGVDVFIGQRLHSVIVAASSGLLPISINYSEKCRNFMNTIRLGELCIDPNDFNVGELDRIVSLSQENIDKYKVALSDNLNMYFKESQNFSRKVVDLIKN